MHKKRMSRFLRHLKNLPSLPSAVQQPCERNWISARDECRWKTAANAKATGRMHYASHSSGSSVAMVIIVADSPSEVVLAEVLWVCRCSSEPAQSMIHPIIQRNAAIGRNSSLIARLCICFFSCEASASDGLLML